MRQACSDLAGLHAEMLPQQAVAESRDSVLNVRFAFCLKHEIAFGIQPHRAVVEIRRAYACQLIVNDDHFGMYIDAFPIKLGYTRVVQAETVLMV